MASTTNASTANPATVASTSSSSNTVTVQSTVSTTNSPTTNPAAGPRCSCGLVAPLKVAQTEANFGRRFYGCPNYEVPAGNCGFFMWRDGPTADHLKHLLIEYHYDKEMYKQRYHKVLKERDTLLCELTDLQSHCQDIGMELVEKRALVTKLEEEVKFGKGLVSRFKEQNVWISVTIAAVLWHLHVI